MLRSARGVWITPGTDHPQALRFRVIGAIFSRRVSPGGFNER
jgi:hypothetical protein